MECHATMAADMAVPRRRASRALVLSPPLRPTRCWPGADHRASCSSRASGAPTRSPSRSASPTRRRCAWPCMRFVVGGLVIARLAWWTRHRGVFDVRPGEWRVLIVARPDLRRADRHDERGHRPHHRRPRRGAAQLLRGAHGGARPLPDPGRPPHPAPKLGGVLIAYAGIVLLFARRLLLPGRDAARRPGRVGSALPPRPSASCTWRAPSSSSTRSSCSSSRPPSGAPASSSSSVVRGSRARPPAARCALAASLVYQGAVIAGFNFVINICLFEVYRPSALATCLLTTPIFGVLAAAAITGDQLTPTLLLSAAMVAAASA